MKPGQRKQHHICPGERVLYTRQIDYRESSLVQHQPVTHERVQHGKE